MLISLWFQLQAQPLAPVVPACATLYPQLWGRRWLVTSLTMQHCWGKSRDQLINDTEITVFIYIYIYIYCIDICSKFDARQAFASYLEHVQNRLLKNTRYNSHVTIPLQLYVIFFFSKQYLHTSSWHREGPVGKWHCSLQSSPPLKCGPECNRPHYVMPRGYFYRVWIWWLIFWRKQP